MKYIVLSAMLLTFAACGDKSTSSESSKSESKTEKTEKSESSNSNYKNGITIKENGLKVSKAMLLNSDGSEIGSDNAVGIGEDVLCRLYISGWKDENGRVKLGASQSIETKEGDVILKEDDLFSTLTDASLEDAGVVTVKATITELKKSIHDFVVVFKVWDKTSDADVSGEYTFHLK